MEHQSSLGASNVVEALYHHTFRILASNPNNVSSGAYPTVATKFNPSMAIIIIVLISAFLFMGFFSIYVRRCTSSDDRTTASAAHAQQQRAAQANAVRGVGQGLDRELVESLPLVGYSLVKGLKGGKDLSECAVCLSEFEEDENLRLLPKCGHVFHPDCIDMWFFSHSTCPLCRASLMPNPDDKEDNTYSEEFRAWVNSRGGVPEAVTIHDGPPLPPNGSVLELLSREGADRILADSLRVDPERLDAGLARREDQNVDRAVEIRALNRALSKNSTSFRKTLRGIEVSERIGAATSGSARFNGGGNPGDGSGYFSGTAMGLAFFERREKKSTRSVGSSHSFNMALRRSSSVGSSGRYIRQLFAGNYADYFSPDSVQDGLRVDRTRLLGTEHRLPVNAGMRRDMSQHELQRFNRVGSVEIPVWDNIELNGDAARAATTGAAGGAAASSPSANMSGELLPHWISNRGLNYPVSAGRKYFSGELPPSSAPRRVDLNSEASGPLYVRRKGKESVEERTKSDRWSLGQLRRTFSLRRSNSDSREGGLESGNVSTSNSEQPQQSKWYWGMGTPTPPPKPVKKFPSPWVGAMKVRRTSSVDSLASATSLPSPSQLQLSSSVVFPQSFPVTDQQQQQPPLPPSSDPSHGDSIQIVTQP